MADLQRLEPSEVIIRRIPPDAENNRSTVERPEGGRRPASSRMMIRREQTGLSCSQLAITTPARLLRIIDVRPESPEGWKVCYLTVGDAEALGLQVVITEADDDPGHCEIRPTDRPFTKGVAQKLAHKAIILTDDQMRTVSSDNPIAVEGPPSL